MIGLGFGIQWLKTSVHLRTLFPADSRILNDYAWIEEHVAPMVPIEVVVGFEKRCPLAAADRFNLIGRIQDELDRTEPIKGTVSAANMMPNMPVDADASSSEYRELLGTILEQAKPYFTAAHYQHASELSEQWRVTAYVSALEDIDYGKVLAAIRERLRAAGAPINRQPAFRCR